jgi:hypothetical protein
VFNRSSVNEVCARQSVTPSPLTSSPPPPSQFHLRCQSRWTLNVDLLSTTQSTIPQVRKSKRKLFKRIRHALSKFPLDCIQSSGNFDSACRIRLNIYNLGDLDIELSKNEPFVRLILLKDETHGVDPPERILIHDPTTKTIIENGFGDSKECEVQENEVKEETADDGVLLCKKKRKSSTVKAPPNTPEPLVITESQDPLQEEINEILESVDKKMKKDSPEDKKEDDVEVILHAKGRSSIKDQQSELFEVNSNPMPV